MCYNEINKNYFNKESAMKFNKLLANVFLSGALFLFFNNCFAYSFNLIFKPQPDKTYTMMSKHKSGKTEYLFNFDLFFLGSPCANVISENPEQKFELNGNQLNKLKRSIRIINVLIEQFNQCSWGERRVKLHQHLSTQQMKLLTLLSEIFQQNDFSI